MCSRDVNTLHSPKLKSSISTWYSVLGWQAFSYFGFFGGRGVAFFCFVFKKKKSVLLTTYSHFACFTFYGSVLLQATASFFLLPFILRDSHFTLRGSLLRPKINLHTYLKMAINQHLSMIKIRSMPILPRAGKKQFSLLYILLQISHSTYPKILR